MNKIILEELNSCKVATIPTITKDTKSIVIPKYTELDLKIDSYYLIFLSDEIVNPSEHDTFACNWNNNKHPKHNYLKVDVTKKLGQMVYVNGIYYDYDNNQDLNEMWEGWLPLKKIKVIKEL